eukprot:TRINITY_DN4840_c0_g1_i3.p2 TRINITY_DN4840_c0_g1~~TRINITY_DN4840_c0_g1_i3.p2  ORF type:complete len:112 (-),score=28.67 TRINITY_DN4840_c0_g1_i3:20-355(-)
MKLTAHEVHRLFLTASTLALKFHCDDYFVNSYYAAVGGVSLEELNELEKDFIETIGYELYVEKNVYKRYEKALKLYSNIHRKNSADLLLSLIHICRCRRSTLCRSRWSPYH